jgi:hypothetical protein
MEWHVVIKGPFCVYMLAMEITFSVLSLKFIEFQ